MVTTVEPIVAGRKKSLRDYITYLKKWKGYTTLDGPAIKAFAKNNNMVDLYESKLLLAEKQELMDEKIDTILYMLSEITNKDDLLKLGIKKGIESDKLENKSIQEIAFIIKSGGYTKDEVKKWKRGLKIEELKKEERASNKWRQVKELQGKISKVRNLYEMDMWRRGLTKDKVLATIVALMDKAKMRVGGSRNPKKYGTYGASTLEPDFIEITDGVIEIRYPGKHEVPQEKRITDEELLESIEYIKSEVDGECTSDDGGERLFCYRENGKLVPVTDNDVREYMKKISGIGKTHIWRYMHGTNIVLDELRDGNSYSNAIGKAAIALGHKKTDPETGEMVPDLKGKTAEKSYVLPEVIRAYSFGRMEYNPHLHRMKEYINKNHNIDTSDWSREELLQFMKSGKATVDDWVLFQDYDSHQ